MLERQETSTPRVAEMKPTKYRECEYVKVHGGKMRKLTQREAEELAQHVQRLRDRLLPHKPIRPDVPK